MRNNGLLLSILPFLMLAAEERPPEGGMTFAVRNYHDSMWEPRKRLRSNSKRGQRRYRAKLSGLR